MADTEKAAEAVFSLEQAEADLASTREALRELVEAVADLFVRAKLESNPENRRVAVRFDAALTTAHRHLEGS